MFLPVTEIVWEMKYISDITYMANKFIFPYLYNIQGFCLSKQSNRKKSAYPKLV